MYSMYFDTSVTEIFLLLIHSEANACAIIILFFHLLGQDSVIHKILFFLIQFFSFGTLCDENNSSKTQKSCCYSGSMHPRFTHSKHKHSHFHLFLLSFFILSFFQNFPAQRGLGNNKLWLSTISALKNKQPVIHQVKRRDVRNYSPVCAPVLCNDKDGSQVMYT